MNYLIYGTSYKLIDQEIMRLTKSQKADVFDLEDSSLEEIIENLSYQSMFDESKIIILKNFAKTISSKKENTNLNKLIEYLKNPNPNTTLIMISKEKINSRGQTKELVSLLNIINTPIITKPYELSKILEEIFRKDGYQATPDTLNLFAEKCANNYDIAINEYEKIKKIKKHNKIITINDIEEYVSNYNLTDIFAFKDSVINKDLARAMKMIDELEYTKMDLVSIVVMLAKEYITLYNIKSLIEKKCTNEEIGSQLNNMHPYRVKLLRTTSTKYSSTELEKIILKLSDLDRRLVSEDNIGFDELRKFIVEL